jgi:hypothetical protein
MYNNHSDFMDKSNKQIQKRNEETNKSLREDGKIECPKCGDYWIDPKKYDVCWFCKMGVNQL